VTFPGIVHVKHTDLILYTQRNIARLLTVFSNTALDVTPINFQLEAAPATLLALSSETNPTVEKAYTHALYRVRLPSLMTMALTFTPTNFWISMLPTMRKPRSLLLATTSVKARSMIQLRPGLM
jgi:hypothetical protein